MTNEIDWDNAPDGTEFYAERRFCKVAGIRVIFYKDGYGWTKSPLNIEQCLSAHDYQERPQPKPKYEYGVEYPTNGRRPDLPDDVFVDVKCNNDYFKNEYGAGERVVGVTCWDDRVTAFRIVDERYKPTVAAVERKAPTTSTEYLSACAHVQSERARQYDAIGTGERSFEAAAEAFNCVTGKNLRGSDVCLILEMVKLVRQYSDHTRPHEDSVLDAVSYASLWVEELTKELR